MATGRLLEGKWWFKVSSLHKSKKKEVVRIRETALHDKRAGVMGGNVGGVVGGGP